MTVPTPIQHRRSIALLLALAALAACSSAPPAAPPGSAPAPAPASRAQSDSAAVARARADSARYPYTAADVRFMQTMIGHHAQAITMARMAPTHGASAELRTLAARIANAQRDEIAIMQQWLRDREQHVPHVDSTGAVTHPAAPGGTHGTHDDHAMLMPGMLTEAQLRELDAARGRDFDLLFLRSMIQHHRGAVAMVEELFRTDGAGQNEGVFRLASDVNVDQITEIARMERMLLALLLEGGSR